MLPYTRAVHIMTYKVIETWATANHFTRLS